MLNYDQIQAYTVYCRQQIQRRSHLLETCPVGKLQCYKNKNGFMALLSVPGQPRVYLRKSQLRLMKKMARKALLEAEIKDFKAELAVCEQFLEGVQNLPHAVENLMNAPGICELLNAENVSSDQLIQEWMNAPYEKYTGYPEDKTIITTTGEKVRSKSEALCLSILHNLNIPFRYEQRWTIHDRVYYPDFTVLRPRDQKIFLIELFGMMGKPDYIRSTCNKIETYALDDWVVGHNLICFYESERYPLDALYMEKTLRYFLLDEM